MQAPVCNYEACNIYALVVHQDFIWKPCPGGGAKLKIGHGGDTTYILFILTTFPRRRGQIVARVIKFPPPPSPSLQWNLYTSEHFLSNTSNNPHPPMPGDLSHSPGFVSTIKRHRNSKRCTPFPPTWSSAKQQIKEECGSQGPKHAVNRSRRDNRSNCSLPTS